MDELGEHGERILEHARAARTPTTADRDRVKHALVARGLMGTAAAGATAAASSTAAAATGATGAGKLVLVVGLVGATVGGALVGTGVLVGTGAPGEPEAQGAPAASTPGVVEPTVEARAAENDGPATPPPEASAPAEVDDDPAAEASAETPARDDGAARADRRRPRRRPSSSSAAEARAPRVKSLADELALLHRAQAARRTDPARALALVREHESRFPRSQLRAERTALHVLLLCDRGQQRAAVRIARPFLRRTEPSPLRRSVQESCVGQPD